ncbi:MAG: CotH kinase family protein [Clostridiales bacterium]|nr:CotH kinase family protein [Clostridiales bacterium]
MRKRSVLSLVLCLAVALAASCAPAAEIPLGETPAPIQCKLTFDTGLGSYIAPLTAPAGTPVSAPAPPVCEGYRFGGWYLGESLYEFFVMPEKSITLTASWIKLYTITFITGSGATAIHPAEYAQGETIKLPKNPVKTGYAFSYWVMNGAAFNLVEMPGASVILTAVWQETNSIIFDLGEEAEALGVTMDPLSAVAGAPIEEPVPPKMPGYVFSRWLDTSKNTYLFDKMPAARETVLTAKWEEASVLPSMFLELSDGFGNRIDLGSVDRENYVKSTVTVRNADESHNFANAAAEFRGRGNGSWSDNGGTGKRGYRIKFGSKLPLFGYTANKHYAIVPCTNEGGGGGGDKTMLQNALAYGLGREVFDHLEYTTNARLIDVYINGEFRGVYLLAELVRVGEGRIDIKSQYNVHDTGYLIEYDSYAAGEGEEGIAWFRAHSAQKYPFALKSPDPDDYRNEGMDDAQWRLQVSWIKNKVSALMNTVFDKNFAAFSELADVDSFVDMYLLQELMKNTDAGWSSLFLYKKPNGKFYMGSPWDFDMSANTTRGDRSPQNLYVAGTGTGSCMNASPNTFSEMFHALYQTPGFYAALVARWKAVSPAVTAFIGRTVSDSFIETHAFAMGRNFFKFGAYGHAGQGEAEAAWATNALALKNWILDRTDWLTNTGPWK